jgi:multidrug efflux pump
MGIAVVGGLIFSGGLTLYVIPAVYAFLPGARRAVAAAHEPPAAGEAEFEPSTIQTTE